MDNSGSIDKTEMVNVMKSIYSMVDGNVAEANRGNTSEKVETIVNRKLMDTTFVSRPPPMLRSFSG